MKWVFRVCKFHFFSGIRKSLDIVPENESAENLKSRQKINIQKRNVFSEPQPIVGSRFKIKPDGLQINLFSVIFTSESEN